MGAMDEKRMSKILRIGSEEFNGKERRPVSIKCKYLFDVLYPRSIHVSHDLLSRRSRGNLQIEFANPRARLISYSLEVVGYQPTPRLSLGCVSSFVGAGLRVPSERDEG